MEDLDLRGILLKNAKSSNDDGDFDYFIVDFISYINKENDKDANEFECLAHSVSRKQIEAGRA